MAEAGTSRSLVRQITFANHLPPVNSCQRLPSGRVCVKPRSAQYKLKRLTLKKMAVFWQKCTDVAEGFWQKCTDVAEGFWQKCTDVSEGLMLQVALKHRYMSSRLHGISPCKTATLLSLSCPAQTSTFL
jgi:hypothetical protein